MTDPRALRPGHRRASIASCVALGLVALAAGGLLIWLAVCAAFSFAIG